MTFKEEPTVDPTWGTYEQLPKILHRTSRELDDYIQLTNDAGGHDDEAPMYRVPTLITLMHLLAAAYDAWLKHNNEELQIACFRAFDSAIDRTKIDKTVMQHLREINREMAD
jgi:hypothetical protein